MLQIRVEFVNLSGGGYKHHQNVAVVCPVHPPKFNFLRNCIYNFYRFGLECYADFWIVFSTLEDALKFGDFERFLTLPENIDLTTRGIVNIKKLYAVSRLAEMDYDYVITIDSDFVFNRNVDLGKLCDRFFDEKVIISCVTDKELFMRINAQCLSRFAHNPKSQEISLNMYSWLNQPCIYKSGNVKKFFNAIGGTEDFNKYVWEDFDYILYTYYLMLYEGFRQYSMPNWSPKLEPFGETRLLLDTFSLSAVKDVHLLVCCKQLYFWIQQNWPDNEIMLITHLDR